MLVLLNLSGLSAKASLSAFSAFLFSKEEMELPPPIPPIPLSDKMSIDVDACACDVFVFVFADASVGDASVANVGSVDCVASVVDWRLSLI